MQGKVLAALVLVMAIGAFFYMRSQGPWCGDDRCDNREFCLIGERDELREPSSFSCEALDDACGWWPSCGCLGLPDGYDCDSNFLGQVTVEMEAP